MSSPLLPRSAAAPLDGTELQDLAKHSAAAAVERLAEVAAALPSCESPQVLEQLARSIPPQLKGLAPEVALALGEVALSLAPCGVKVPADVMSLEPRLRVQWLRVGLLGRRDHAEAVVQQLGDDALLLAITQGWSLDASPVAAAVLQRMAHAGDARLRLRAVESIHSAVWNLAISVADAFSILALMARPEEPHAVRIEALRRLASSWILGLSPQAARQREQLIGAALRGEGARRAESAARGARTEEKAAEDAEELPEESPEAALLAGAAVAVSRALGLRPLLADVVADECLPASRRALALAALGTVATGEDVAAALALGTADPLGFGPAARDFLLEAHRRGAFVREPDLPAVLELFDHHASWRGEELVRVTYLARKPLVEILSKLPAHDPRWIRRAAILAASVGAEAHLVLAAKLDELRGRYAEAAAATAAASMIALGIARALLEAAGQSAELADEEALLGWLGVLPEAALPALRAKGGAASAARLKELVLDPFTPDRLYGQALEVLWALASDRPALLAELTQQLRPHRLDLTDPRFVAPRDRTVAALLAGDPAQQKELEPKEQLGLYCEAGDLQFLPQVRALFRELLRGYVQKALEGDFTIKRLLLPELEQQVFRYGRHLIKDGRPVRRWREAGAETGRDLVLRLVCEWLAEEPEDPICVALLEVASRHAPEGAYLRFLERYWRKGDVNVRRAALEALAMAPAGSHGLELSLGRLVDEDTDPRLLVQALEAVKSLRAAWAEPLVVRALERREMGVKQAAAEALAELGSGRSVPALVGWLSRHDNESFRGSLSRALSKAAGEGRVAVLIEALGQLAQDAAAPRARELLWRALAGHLRLAAVLQLARSEDGEHRALIEACRDGRVAVADASAEQVAAALHRARLRPSVEKRDPAKRLRIEGFSIEAALELLAEHQAGNRANRDAATKDAAAILAAVRVTLPSWLSWLDGEADPSAPAIELALEAAAPGEQVPRALALAERWKERLEPADVASFVERCLAQPAVAPGLRLRALALVRALAPSAKLGGLRRYRLLGELGAVRTLADLEQALDECRVRPSAPAECEQLLGEALAIPPAPPAASANATSATSAANASRAARRGRDETPAEREARELREAARDWTRTDDKVRRAWLAQAVAARPLELPLAAPLAEAPKPPPFRPASRGDLEQLLATLEKGDGPERTRAARHLLSWQDASDAWPQVLRGYLEGEVALERDDLRRLADALVRFPDVVLPESDESAESDESDDSVEVDAPQLHRLALVVAHVPPWSARALAAQWIPRWEGGEWSYGELLRALGQEQLLPLVVERVRAGKPELAALLTPASDPPMRALIELLTTSAPAEAARLSSWRAEEREERTAADAPLADPIAGKGLAELVETLDDKRIEKGLAVRAIHALARLGEPAIEPLSRFATDRRPQIRSAALRALRTVAPRQHTLEVTTRVLAMETRRDVTLQLMASLAHGRHEPALPDLLERVLDRDPRIREGATDSLRAWGTDILPAIHREARRARPDHRRQLEALIETLSEG